MTTTDDWHELPVAEVYRGVEIFGLQSPERIEQAKRQIDIVIAKSGPRRLYAFACDPSRSPEARQLARLKALATIQPRQRASFSVDRLDACCFGIERRTPRLARLVAGRQADWWPEAWHP